MTIQSSTAIDRQLLEIDGLKWLPWIGEIFLDLNRTDRLLIVGESHYRHNPPRLEEADKYLTRSVVVEEAIKIDHKHKMFPNLHKALFGEENFNPNILWSHLSFYNFVQRLMEGNKDRPRKDDFVCGWEQFFKLIEIIKPTTCLFVGTRAADFFSKDTQHVIEKGTDVPINRAYPRIANFKNQAGQPIKLIFIRHTSSYFSWKEWNPYLNLNKEMKPQLDFLKSKAKTE